ncbi:MAG TPA: 50S ribosomal protein L23 [Candidatus Saccharimonadales bacterium]|jgi:large subunit ribosomal protein L23|nr:50S ribosomal protein L23 [Candidatus Saccharimonadales bacterium]
MVLKPRMSEKTYGLAATGHVYTFDVPSDATKHTVARAVAAQFDVTPVEVNIINVKGKPKRSVRKGGRAMTGRRSDVKKAYVTLKEGDRLPFFDRVEEAEKKAADAEKKADKKEKK